MAGSKHHIELERLGPTPQAAVRVLMTEFRSHGWSDREGAALAVVRAVQERADGRLGVGVASRAVPKLFLTRNQITRSDVLKALERIAQVSD